MSAIWGLFARDGRPAGPDELERVQAALAHRGPDGAGLWSDGPLGLGHLALYTTPEAGREQLPVRSRDGALAVTADARLDNRDELIGALGLDERPPALLGDGELILAAYERWGEGCAARLLGDFAFAVWDGRRRRLFLARDHFGVRPLYYHQSAGLFAFATEIKGLLAIPAVPRRLNELRVAELMTRSLRDHGLTFYSDVASLPPAHVAVVCRDGVAVRPYWQLDPTRELRLGSDAEYAEAVRETFLEAVRCRLRGHTPVGAMLSGGIDSSSIVCAARQLLAAGDGRRLHTFSAVFERVPSADEGPYIEAVLAGGGLEPHFIAGDEVSPFVEPDMMLRHLDEVMDAGNLSINWCAYRSARERGALVVLDGFDGDNTISHGLGYLTELALGQRWLRLAAEVRAYSRRTGADDWRRAYLSWVRQYGVGRLARSVRRALGPLARPGPAAADDGAAWAPFLRRDLVRRSGIADRRRALPPAPRTDRERQHMLLTSPGEARALAKLDHAAGAFGVEVRFPFWDRRLVELCLALPPEQKLHRGWTRMVMRRAMAGILPEQVRWRGGKSDLGPAFEHNFFSYEGRRIEALVREDAELIDPLLDVASLRAACGRRREGRASEQDVLAIWRAVSLAMWLRHTRLSP